ncbi:hypothetical protein BDB01DRAFT_909072 [Pilobolus umbonatus]|nr:hypothetical protein BDB01DRAFT_909072 [Pilobolus umbonatus]
MTSHLTDLTQQEDPSSLPSAFFGSNYYYPRESNYTNDMNSPTSRQIYILPPPSSLPGYHLPPPSPNYYYQQPPPNEFHPHYYYTPSSTPPNTTKRELTPPTIDDKMIHVEKKRQKKTMKSNKKSVDDISMAAATLASFAADKNNPPYYPHYNCQNCQFITTDEDDLKKHKLEVHYMDDNDNLLSKQVLEAAKILMNISRCVQVSTVH